MYKKLSNIIYLHSVHTFCYYLYHFVLHDIISLLWQILKFFYTTSCGENRKNVKNWNERSYLQHYEQLYSKEGNNC